MTVRARWGLQRAGIFRVPGTGTVPFAAGRTPNLVGLSMVGGSVIGIGVRNT